MSGSGFEWKVSPNVIAKNLELYEKRALVALYAIAEYWGNIVQEQARNIRTWEDRTGNARSGLFYAVEGFGFEPRFGSITPVAKDSYKLEDGTVINRGRQEEVSIESGDEETLIIVLAHTVFYGKFLELSNGGKNAIIMSLIEANLPILERLVKETFK